MKINYLKTVGFRKFENEFETVLYDVTNITGKNRSGKSNILYAIVNIFFGTNLTGDDKVSLINHNCDASYGELHFTDNAGINHILIRGKNKYNSKKNILQLDGKNVTQTDLSSFYKDKQLFLAIINPLYFLNKKPSDQKKLIDKYLSDIKPKDIFDTLNKNQQQLLLKKYYKNSKSFDTLSEKEQADAINLSMFNIPLDIAYNNLSIAEQISLEGIPNDIPKYITELNDEIKNSTAIINSLDGKIEYAKITANAEIPKFKNFEKATELSLAKQELEYLNSNEDIINKENQKKIVENIEKDILNKETEISELKTKMMTGKKIYYNIKNADVSTCPMCEQIIQDSSINKTLANMKIELTQDFDKHNLLEAQIKDLKVKLTMEKCKYHSFEGNTSIEKSKRIANVKETIEKLELEEKTIQKYNNEVELTLKAIDNAKKDIAKFNTDKNKYLSNIEQLNIAKKTTQKFYISYIEEKMKLVKKYLKDVDIKYYSVLKTDGEIKDDFIITYKNKSLSDLSRSETIATALEFANMFNQISRGYFPIFIDDYESCADYDFVNEYSKNCQLIISTVEKGTDLKIADANSDKFTVFNSNIYNTKNTNNDAVNIKQAA